MLIYQVDDGGDNSAKLPLGGVILQNSPASSMAISIANPITFYGSWSAVISQAGHSGDLYDYYWTSYSRGVDGRTNTITWIHEPNWHNGYLDGYIPLRVKSIYDPCPYLYRIPSNGTWNQFTYNVGWTADSYPGGVNWNLNTLGESWIPGLGRRHGGSSGFVWTANYGYYYTSTSFNGIIGYTFTFNSGKYIALSYNSDARSTGMSVRCIEVTRRYAHTFCQQKVCKKRFNVTFVAPKGISMQQMRAARR